MRESAIEKEILETSAEIVNIVSMLGDHDAAISDINKGLEESMSNIKADFESVLGRIEQLENTN